MTSDVRKECEVCGVHTFREQCSNCGSVHLSVVTEDTGNTRPSARFARASRRGAGEGPVGRGLRSTGLL